MNNIIKMNLEDVMGDRFGKYSKYIIQDRALPDIRDGLKPVQRRILFAMHSENNTFNNAYRKSAKTVGNVIGNYHPHGDTSVYDAMVRLSQNWKLREPLVEMHGNNGSIDGDRAAAMRYTEARLSKISSELLEDIKMNTVDMIYNFDDTMLEPTVLPAKYPNLIVNGASGISAGYATNIPPHNLKEVIDALIYLIKNPSCRVDTLFKYIKGPDFPLGGVVSGENEIQNALRSGKGRVVLKAKYDIEVVKGKELIVVTEIPYEINKANLVYKIDEVRELGKVSGINEVRDESDKEGIRIVVELKKDANSELILNYLLKNTDLQTYYNYNMVAIVDSKPKLVGIKEVLEAYYNHQVDVITRRSKFELEKFTNRLHIIEGLVIALDKIDLLIKVIRSSNNKREAIENVAKEFKLSERQSEAIVNLQLYRLTNTDVNELLNEKADLERKIMDLKELLSNKDVLDKHLIDSLKAIGKEYGNDRRTVVEEKFEVIKIDEKALISNDEVIVTVTKDGYIKKTSMKSFSSSEFDDFMKKEDDYLISACNCRELQNVIAFTSKGNYVVVPIHEIEYKKWKELGAHISSYVLMKSDEEIVNAYIIDKFDCDNEITVFSSDGYGKRVALSSLAVSRFNKPYTILKLASGERMISASFGVSEEYVLVSKNGFGLRFDFDQLSVQGPKSKGVKAIDLKEDSLIFAQGVNNKYILTVTDDNKSKRLLIEEISKLSRGRKGNLIIKRHKGKDIFIRCAIQVGTEDLLLRFDNSTTVIKSSSVTIGNSTQYGSVINKNNVVDISFNISGLDSNKIVNCKEVKLDTNDNAVCEKNTKNEPILQKVLKKESKSDIINNELDFEEITIDDLLD